MIRAARFLGLPESYREAAPTAFVAPDNLRFVEERAAGRRILDYGCGAGGYSLALAQRGFECVAVDVDAELVAHARDAGVDARVVDAGARLPFDDGSFDTVILFETLEHVRDYEQVLREARRVARANVLITVPDCTATPLLARASVVFDHYLADDHVNFFSVDEIGAALSRVFARHDVHQGNYIDLALFRELFPLPIAYAAAALMRLRLMRPRLSYRLFADARV